MKQSFWHCQETKIFTFPGCYNYIKKKIKEKGWEGRKGKGDTGRWGQDGRGRRENHQNNTNGSVWIRQMWPSCFYFSAFVAPWG